MRPLLEKGSDTFVRYNQAISVIRKVVKPDMRSFSELVNPQTPFGIVSSYKGQVSKTNPSDVRLYKSGHESEHRGQLAYAPYSMITKGFDLINVHKVYLGEASSSVGSFPHPILTRPFYGEPGTICTQSYLVIGPFSSKEECNNVISYMSTKFFRFMVLQRKNTQHNMSHVFRFVPIVDFSKPWTDAELYKMYNISDEEIEFIDSMVKPME